MSTMAIPSAASPPMTFGDTDRLYEIVDGQEVEVPPMGAYENHLAGLLLTALLGFCQKHRLGTAIMETLFDLGSETPQRRPDVAFVSRQRWPHREVSHTNAWSVIPDLAVEVVSQSNTAWEIAGKVDEYLRAGVVAVWVIYPELKQVYVHESSTSARIVGLEGHLEGSSFLPGFSTPVASLFEELTAGD